uniref:Uncharacterized protein n=1 Tax=Rhizophagus irregularis (strain DAOM 181602 / DAOM 197198 / MUCL 43194) TaxID=747089 RepID=U9UFB0_RHIID
MTSMDFNDCHEQCQLLQDLLPNADIFIIEFYLFDYSLQLAKLSKFMKLYSIIGHEKVLLKKVKVFDKPLPKFKDKILFGYTFIIILSTFRSQLVTLNRIVLVVRYI